MAKIVFNKGAVYELITSPEIMADITRRAEAIADAANADGHHVVHVEIGKRRPRAAVVTADFKAARAEANRQNLTRALGAGRG